MTPRDLLPDPSRRGAVAALAVAVLLSGCGGTSAGSRTDPFGPPPSTPSTVVAPAPAPAPAPTLASAVPSQGPVADPSATPSSSARPSFTQPSPNKAPTAAASPPTAASEQLPWTGTFRGKKVKVPRGHGAHISFTFDDGPSPTFTPQVLALLAKNDVPAVFCLIGQQARVHPDLVRKEVKAGHVLCDHSRDHDLYMNRKGQAYVTREITDGLSAIHAASPNTPVRFYRQPGGTWSSLVVHAMHHSNLTPLRWTDDPRDWSRPGSQAIVHRVVAHLTPGGVILMHDGGGDRTQTVEALAWLLHAVIAAGWTPVLAPQRKISDKAAARSQ